MSEERSVFEGWAILELMGHRRLGGFVQEQEIAGHGFLRIDVPGENGNGDASQFYSPGSVYCLTPTTEAMARAVARHNQPQPVSRWELPKPSPRPTGANGEDIEAEQDLGYDDDGKTDADDF
jgi:hypothetical protein